MSTENTPARTGSSAPPATVKVAPKPGLLAAMAARHNVEPAKFMATLKATAMPSNKPVSDEEFMAFCMVAHEYGLNPLTKEIYAFPDKRGGITPVVGVDGWVKLMNRQESFDGIEFEAVDDESGNPHAVTAKIHVKGRSRPVAVTEYYKECARGTEPWKTCPRRMLRHKALIQASRVAFGFAGIHDEDDALAMAVNVTPEPARPIFKAPATIAPPPPLDHEPEPEDQIPGAEVPPVASVQDDLASFVLGSGVTVERFVEWYAAEGYEPQGLTSFAEVPEAVAKKLLRSKTGLVAALNGGAK